MFARDVNRLFASDDDDVARLDRTYKNPDSDNYAGQREVILRTLADTDDSRYTLAFRPTRTAPYPRAAYALRARLL